VGKKRGGVYRKSRGDWVRERVFIRHQHQNSKNGYERKIWKRAIGGPERVQEPTPGGEKYKTWGFFGGGRERM